MSAKRVNASPTGNTSTSRGGVLIQLSLTGLTIFSVALVATSALVTHLVTVKSSANLKSAEASADNRAAEASIPVVANTTVREQANPPPWGQLVSWDIDLEQPVEYLAYEIATNKMETWTFVGMTPTQVRSLLQSCGVAAGEIDRALSPPLLSLASSNTVIIPDDELVFSLTPESRAKLYAVLGRFPANHLMKFPFCLVGSSADETFAGSQLTEMILEALRKLLYPRGNGQCFSDLGIMLRRLPTEQDRMLLLKAVSRQSAVMARVQIWPDTDIDKLIGYWGRGVQTKDLRPLLESLKRVPGGAAISLLYFLPQFARQRLYTYPEPSQPGDQAKDCHWSTMNFFNETPDDRFADPKYTVPYLQANYYAIAQPGAYGDLIFFLNADGEAIHSAVYLADGIVFTKNGNNMAQPWMLMHLDDLAAKYTTDAAPSMMVYRKKSW
ncbi:MAG TPA: hypothetical protein VMB80_18630 [Candidatus Acidoferrum sp.]|nr:hypothetical protein [Candidatus Acidoferrum sp.]